MRTTTSSSRWSRTTYAVLVAVLAIVTGMQALLTPSADAAPGDVPISGSGSTWSSNAIDQWRRNVANQEGLLVNYAPIGSTSGRTDFRFGQVDFAVSETPYGLTDGGVLDPVPTRAFGYLPIVAGGTAFMYNLKIGDKRVTNLRLSGDTVTKIFTQVITRWDDPAIKADNPNLTLPARKIVPVVRTDGSGTTAQFTAWMASQYSGLWDDYCHRAGRNVTPCGFTSFYPANGLTNKPGSTGVAGFVAQDSSEGAITYVEYSYARNSGFPVAKVLNKANYYVEPKATSVAVALLKAKINPSDLTSDLSAVYADPDPRAYPLSSYSYMIIPKDTGPNTHFTTEKGHALSEFAYYFLCEGQQQADALGYSPLPINLVAAGVDQVGQIPGSTHKLSSNNLSSCHNPTFSPDGTDLLATNTPQPDPCDLRGAPTQCGAGTGGAPGPVPGPVPTPAPTPPPTATAKATGTTLKVLPYAAFQGFPVILLANVAPRRATGTVQLTDGTTALGAPVPVRGGRAVLITSTLTAGTHPLTAVFTPTNPASFAPSTSPPVSLTVRPLSARLSYLGF